MRSIIWSGLLFILIMFSTAIFAATPTMEGLFRNGDNKEITSNFAILKFYINEVVDEEKLKITTISEEAGELNKSIEVKSSTPRYFKLIYSLEKESRIQMLQVEYNNVTMKDADLVKATYFSDVVKKIEADEFIERPLLYSFLTMFVFIYSKAISTQLGRYDQEFLTNLLAMNEAKKQLLLKQKNYLAAIKDDKEAKEGLKSPFDVDTDEEKEKIAEIRKQDMYNRSNKVKLERVGRRFMWNLKLDNINAFFGNRDHRLRNINIVNGDKKLEVNCGNYVLLDGIHKFPEVIKLKDLNGSKFDVFMTYLLYRPNKGSSLFVRYQEYLKKITKLKRVIAEDNKITAKDLFY
jgi:hypothetical protein